jgi:hypothetical protein
MKNKTEYIIDLWDGKDRWTYKEWHAREVIFDTVEEAEAKIDWIFKFDPSIVSAKIVRVEKTEVKQISSYHFSLV